VTVDELDQAYIRETTAHSWSSLWILPSSFAAESLWSIFFGDAVSGWRFIRGAAPYKSWLIRHIRWFHRYWSHSERHFWWNNGFSFRPKGEHLSRNHEFLTTETSYLYLYRKKRSFNRLFPATKMPTNMS
jgi:hypothetical protein